MILKNCILMLLLTICSWSAEESPNLNPMDPSFVLTVVDKLNQGENIIFAKYGDGEYYCMAGFKGANCDNDSYHPWLGKALQDALISLCKKPNTYIGKWWNADAYDYCNTLAAQNGLTVPWAWYHLVLNDDEFMKYDYMRQFVRFIINTKRKKILFCNSENIRLKDFFRADACIVIPSQNWSLNYEKWRTLVEQSLEKDAIVLTAGGMCSKVLINDITNHHDITCIDLGSSFDLLARRRHSRSHKHSYSEEIQYYKEFLPPGWN